MMRTRGEQNGWFLLALALVLFVTSGYLVVNNILFLRAAKQAQGEVVANREERLLVKGGEVTKYYPLVQFIDEAGVAHRVEVSLGLESPVPVGVALPVLYPPGEPGNARVGDSHLWGWSVGVASGGAFFLLCGSVLIVGARTFARWGVPMRT